jgi:hypothetical protein
MRVSEWVECSADSTGLHYAQLTLSGVQIWCVPEAVPYPLSLRHTNLRTPLLQTLKLLSPSITRPYLCPTSFLYQHPAVLRAALLPSGSSGTMAVIRPLISLAREETAALTSELASVASSSRVAIGESAVGPGRLAGELNPLAIRQAIEAGVKEGAGCESECEGQQLLLWLICRREIIAPTSC